MLAGNNANGRIGFGSNGNVSTLTKINIGKTIETISKGRSTHTAISDYDGYVYTTGTNTLGELGNGNNINVTNYTKIGDTVIDTDEEIYYLDLNETREIKYKLINTFNLKIDVIDDIKENFTLNIPDNKKLVLNNYNMITTVDYGVNNVTITHNETGKSKEIIIKVIKKMNDIIQGIRDCNLTDGIYEIMIQDEIYNIELYNFYDNVTYSLDGGENSKIISLGNDISDETMLVVKYHGNLKIDEGITLTAKTRKKGMYVCVLGDIINNGEITMTARGADVEEGQDVFLWENIDSSYEYVPAEGANGLVAFKPLKSRVGIIGNSGSGRQTGGGGQGAAIINGLNGSSGSWIGASTGGNSYRRRQCFRSTCKS